MAGMLAAAGGTTGLGATAMNAAATQAGQNFANPRSTPSQQKLNAYSPEMPPIPEQGGISDLIGTQRAMRTPAPLNVMDLLQQTMQ